ncbi:hypothetical protein NA56DRAFT_100394 [Hyaloscypha hepaticicola]|uniref:Mid2 domain-containing protein n=1 Tax=Hyaloscypha hepaticicola TaxID=2082293 RepID=A0A2J6Q7Z3_9HELO|nr:hypothetical protein NA56DRAFT_100394 [Hyaloscypha hepaticicola]
MVLAVSLLGMRVKLMGKSQAMNTASSLIWTPPSNPTTAMYKFFISSRGHIDNESKIFSILTPSTVAGLAQTVASTSTTTVTVTLTAATTSYRATAHPSCKQVAVGAGVGVPLGLIAVGLAALLLLRERKTRTRIVPPMKADSSREIC